MVKLFGYGNSLLLLSTAFLFFSLFLCLLRPAQISLLRPFGGSSQQTRGIHFLLPTTSTSPEVCKVIFGGAVLGYPVASLLGWEGRGRFNGSESHLFKLSETLFYLNTLRKDQDDDLVLILDAFDIWLQLPPEVTIRRFLRAIEKENQRLKSDRLLGAVSVDDRTIKNTILFGADKFCWPQDGEKIDCGAFPNSTLPSDFLGPNTDGGEVSMRPRYLNSGTIMGPVGHLRDLFRATLEKVDLEWNDDFEFKNSDQHYLSLVWAEQEVARTRVKNGTAEETEGEQVEFHIAVDHESDAFLIQNGYSQYLTWMTFNRSTAASESQEPSSAHNMGRLDRLLLGEDIMSSPGPYSAADEDEATSLPTELSWADVMLGTNTATGTVFPLYHLTGNKLLRGLWWARMWFHPHGENLLKAARKRWLANIRSEGHHVVATVDGVQYIAKLPNDPRDVFQGMRARDKANLYGGAWNDLGEYMSWKELCGKEEFEVFLDRAAP